MELWVRSQDRIVLKKLQDIEYYKDGKKHFVIGGSLLGEYKTKERCLEIIDEIQWLLINNGRESDHIAQMLSGVENKFIVYKMPQE